MKKLTIGAQKHTAELLAYLARARDELAEQGIRLVGEQQKRGKYTFYTYRLVGTDKAIDDNMTEFVVQALAGAVASFITEVWERQELQEIVANNFYYYAADEVEYITDSAVKMLSELLEPDGSPLRHGHILNVVSEQMRTEADLLIDGVMAFRLRDLREDLPRVIEQAIDEYLMDLEYQEFVKLLRYFLDVQDSEMDLLHMLCINESTVRLFDADGKFLPLEQIRGKAQPMFGEPGGPVEDTVLSSLITLAPKKLVLHTGAHETTPPIAETVKKIFLDKAEVCNNCPLCRVAVEWQEEEEQVSFSRAAKLTEL